MKFNINITTDGGELLSIIPIDTDDDNWDTCNTKHELANDIIDEIRRAVLRA